MSHVQNPVAQLLREDPRYQLEAYQFVREALTYAQESMAAGDDRPEDTGRPADPVSDELTEPSEVDRHLTGQQLCEAIRRYALEQFGYMTQVVLKSWGVTNTGDFGEIVYNLIRIGFMKKSEADRREDFDNVYNFEDAFRHQFHIAPPES
jgi:uncharacterized repeat protein (TIGR04138 family)